jgi:beta-lactamase superfamily II metal-dependent hydrolase
MFLLRRYADTIEALVISHNDADHDYNAPGVLTQYRKAIHRIFFLHDRDVQEMKRTFAVLREAREGDYPRPQRLEANGGEPRILFSADGVVLSVMYPDLMSNLAAQNSGKARPNLTSAILRLSCYGRRVVFGGDAPNEAWEYLSSRMPNEKPLECNIMAIPHHGGNVTNGLPDQNDAQEKLYSKVIRPEYGIVSVGTNNQYGHPSDVTIAALRKAGVKVLCTQMTEKCCDDLEKIRHMRSIVTRPARSRAKATKTTAHRSSKHIACYGTIFAEISSEQVKISGLSRWQEDFLAFAGVSGFHPLCG